MRPRRGYQFDRHLNVALAENPFFEQLFAVLAHQVDSDVGERLSQLSELRSALHVHRGDWLQHNGEQMRVAQVAFEPDAFDNAVQTRITLVDRANVEHTVWRRAVHDRQVLIDSARQLGFDYYSDTISDISYVQIIENLAQFWPENGSYEFIDFIGYIKQTRLAANQLWTPDETGDGYVSLEPRGPHTVPVHAGGVDYPTSHYELIYDALSNSTVDLTDIVSLFYLFAPINYVLQRISGEINLESNYAVVSGGAVQVTENIQIPVHVPTGSTLRVVGFELGQYTDDPNQTEPSQYTVLRPNVLDHFWASQYTSDHIRYAAWDETVVLKCYVPHAAPAFRYNAVRLWATVDNGPPFVYSLTVFPVVNPKLSSERRGDGSSWYLWVRLVLPDTVPRNAFTWDATAEVRPVFRSVAHFNELDRPVYERQEQFIVGSHPNVPLKNPHTVFTSETLYYGSILLDANDPVRMPAQRIYVALEQDQPIPEDLVPVTDHMSNSLIDARGRRLYYREAG